jgi:hypothetical protein
MLLETFTRVTLAADPPVNPTPIEPRGANFHPPAAQFSGRSQAEIPYEFTFSALYPPPGPGVVDFRQFAEEQPRDQ